MALNIRVILSAVGLVLGLVGLAVSLLPRRSADIEVGYFDYRKTVRVFLPSFAAGLIALSVTRWPVAALFAALAVGATPTVLGKTSSSIRTGRIEALAVWTELLRDTLGASSGLGEAIMATAPVAPIAIRPEVSKLADRLVGGVPMTDGLRSFADELDDPSGDMVASALLISAGARTQRLGDVLTALANSIREEVAMRLRVETSRVAARSSVRTIVVFSVLFVAVLMVVARSYLAPLGTPVGQAVLATVGICYGSGIALMLHLVRPVRDERILGTHRPSSQRQTADLT
jgi:tight adherence protein B